MGLTICVDFDGTLCEHVYPEIGKEVPKAFEYLKKYQKAGAKIILFTMRSSKPYNQKIVSIDPNTNEETIEYVDRDCLQEAVDWCKKNGLEFYGVNSNPTQKYWTRSPKAYGQLYVDDAAVGCPLIYEEGKRPYVDWESVDKIIENRIKSENI
jgi:hydroxymethylpyrimidine pyrophosphatase-like HAD family hydrolase